MGRITAITDSPEGKNMQIDFPLGRFTIPLEGDFAEGDLLRLIFTTGNVRLEKQTIEDATVWMPQGQNQTVLWPVIRDLLQLEETLSDFLKGTERDREPRVADSLPTLIQKVLEQKEGLPFLVASLEKLQPQAINALTTSIARLPVPSHPDEQRRFMNLMQGFRQALAQLESKATSGMASGLQRHEGGSPIPIELGKDLLRYLRPTSGSTLYLGRGIVSDRVVEPSGFRYRIDMGGAKVEAVSRDDRQVGDFVSFGLEKEQGKLRIRFQNPESVLPSELRSSYASANAGTKASLLLASDFLKGEISGPALIQATKEFAQLLVDTQSLQGLKPSMPTPDELDKLFRMLLAFPRDPVAPELQARVWDQAGRDISGMASLLRLLRPEGNVQGKDAFLSPESKLIPILQIKGEEPSSEAAQPLEALRLILAKRDIHEKENALTFDNLLKIATEMGKKLDGGRDPGAQGTEKFWAQALVSMLPKEEDGQKNQPGQLHFYHQNEWHMAYAGWQENTDPKARTPGSPEQRPVQVDITTQGKNLGAVEVKMLLHSKGSQLEFRNEYQDVRTLLSQSLGPLEKLLLDWELPLAGWTYAQLEKKATPLSDFPLLPMGNGPKPTLDLLG